MKENLGLSLATADSLPHGENAWTIKGTDKVHYATWASLIAAYRHKAQSQDDIQSIVFPAMGAGFGGAYFDDVAR
ncbi:MAG: hypothetical protein AAF664_21930 [Planctomycetota bacterium]